MTQVLAKYNEMFWRLEHKKQDAKATEAARSAAEAAEVEAARIKAAAEGAAEGMATSNAAAKHSFEAFMEGSGPIPKSATGPLPTAS